MSDLRAIPDWLTVSSTATGRLNLFADLVAKWARAVNLVAPSSLPHLWTRHVLDSAQLLHFVSDGGPFWADLGSGGGFPGIVVAILLAETKPEASVTLVESDQRKAAFLVQATRELGLSTRVLPRRIEELAPLGAHTVTARALAPLSDLLGHAARHLTEDGRAIFLKGARHGEELEAAARDWHFQFRCHKSRTEPDAAILEVSQIARR